VGTCASDRALANCKPGQTATQLIGGAWACPKPPSREPSLPGLLLSTARLICRRHSNASNHRPRAAQHPGSLPRDATNWSCRVPIDSLEIAVESWGRTVKRRSSAPLGRRPFAALATAARANSGSGRPRAKFRNTVTRNMLTRARHLFRDSRQRGDLPTAERRTAGSAQAAQLPPRGHTHTGSQIATPRARETHRVWRLTHGAAMRSAVELVTETDATEWKPLRTRRTHRPLTPNDGSVSESTHTR
jgi:hypothetical protein